MENVPKRNSLMKDICIIF